MHPLLAASLANNFSRDRVAAAKTSRNTKTPSALRRVLSRRTS
jgi:hypothetical protein